MKLLLLLIALSLPIFALEFSFEGEIEGIFDNREFPSLTEPAETYFGIRPTAFIGIKIDDMHKVNFGANYFFQFGQESGKGTVHPIVNYQFTYEPHFFIFGTAPRRSFLTVAPYFISDAYDYNNPVFGGTAYQFTPDKHWAMGLWLDWVGMKSTTQKEAFLLGAHARYQGDTWLFLETQFMYNHTANKEGTTGDVQDYNGWIINGGWQKDEGFKRIQHLSFGITPQFTFSRDRSVSKAYNLSLGLEEQALILFQRFGIGYQHFNDLAGTSIKATLPTGDSRYLEHSFDKIDILFFPLGKVDTPITITAELSFIIADGVLNHQEKLLVSVPFAHTFKGKSNDNK